MLLITPTSDRPFCLNLCSKYISRQKTFRPIYWTICDDGLVKSKIEFSNCLAYHYFIQHRLKGELISSSVQSFLYNISSALRVEENDEVGYLSKVDSICFIEDDDWYHEDYIEFIASGLERYDVYGIGNVPYYSINFRRYKLMSGDHTSLSALGIRKSVLPLFQEALRIAIVNNSMSLDLIFWKLLKKSNFTYKISDYNNLILSLKGLPGKVGLGIGHKSSRVLTTFTEDIDCKYLYSIIGKDIINYRNI